MPIYKSKKAKATQQPQAIKGRFIGNERGFGFVVQEDPALEDIFIPPSMTGGAIHGDEVLCVINIKKPEPPLKKKGRRTQKAQAIPPLETSNRQTAQIVEITQRKSLIGTYYTVGQGGFVRPIEGKIPYVFSVSPKTRNRFGLADGHRVFFLVPKPRRTPSIDEHTLPAL